MQVFYDGVFDDEKRLVKLKRAMQGIGVNQDARQKNQEEVDA